MGTFEYLKQFLDWRFFRLGTTAVEVTSLTVKLPSGQVRYVRKKHRIPDLIVLTTGGAQQLCDDDHKITLSHDSPLLIIDWVSEPGTEESYIDQRAQYESRGVYEYWIIDNHQKQVSVLTLTDDGYEEACYRGEDWVNSKAFPELALTACGMLPLEAQ